MEVSHEENQTSSGEPHFLHNDFLLCFNGNAFVICSLRVFLFAIRFPGSVA